MTFSFTGWISWITRRERPHLLTSCPSEYRWPSQAMNILAELSRLGNMLAGTNYVVFFHVYDFTHDPNADLSDIILECFPVATVGNVVASDAASVLAEFDRDVQYRGDSSSGPKPGTIDSDNFKALFATVRAHFASLCDDADTIHEFWLSDGHPDYPVQWDFAFLLRFGDSSAIWMGSSSD